MFPGAVSFLAGTAFAVRTIPTCSTFPGRAADVALAVSTLGATGSRVPLPPASCFDPVVANASYDELFFPTLVAIEEGRFAPNGDLLREDSAVIAGVADSITVRVPAAAPSPLHSGGG